MIDDFKKKIFFNILHHKLNKSEIIKLHKTYHFLENIPYKILKKKHADHFKKMNILNKDISVLKYTNYGSQLTRALNNYYYINKVYTNYSNVLDLGCGVGFYLYVNKFFKKNTTGIDWFQANNYYRKQSIEFIKKYNKILKINPVNYKITKDFKPKVQKFDLVTAFSANFDGYYKDRYNFIPWNFNEYKKFFDQIEKYLTPNGKFFFKFNEKWEYKKNYFINKKFENYLIKKELWYGKGIITNIKFKKETLKLLNI